MKYSLLVVPVLFIAGAMAALPKPQSASSIESLKLVKEEKSFTKVIYADGSFIGMDGNSYYSMGQNNYMGSNGNVYYSMGQNSYMSSNGGMTYNGLGGLGLNVHVSSLSEKSRTSHGIPQPKIALASR